VKVGKKATAGAVVAIAAATISLTASYAGAKGTRATGHAAGSGTIAFVCATAATNSFFAPVEAGARAAAHDMGVHLNYTGLGSTVSPAAMSQVLTPAVNSHPAALIVCNFFPQAVDPLIKQAVKEGIPVIGTQSGVANSAADGAIVTVGQADFAAGKAAGAAMYVAGVRHPVCVDHQPTNPSVVERCQGFAAAFAKHGVKAQTLNLSPSIYSDQTQQMDAMKGDLDSHRNIDGMLTLGAPQGTAAVQAVAEAGRTGKVKVGAFDVATDVVNDIKSGKMLFTVWQQPYLEGYLPVVAAALYVRHGFTPAGELYTGPTLVTKQNAGLVKKALAAGEA
jgi:simple sugar transport system substrate-binding protein